LVFYQRGKVIRNRKKLLVRLIITFKFEGSSE
jgi:hypothetical protein